MGVKQPGANDPSVETTRRGKTSWGRTDFGTKRPETEERGALTVLGRVS